MNNNIPYYHFEQNNCQVVLLTDQKEEKINKDKFNIKKINYINATQIFKNEKFDLIIASLGYAKNISYMNYFYQTTNILHILMML